MQYKYLVSFNNGFEGDENNDTKGFNDLDEAKKYAKEKCDKYYAIDEGEFEWSDEDKMFYGSGKQFLSNCKDRSVMWFYSYTSDFCEVEDL